MRWGWWLWLALLLAGCSLSFGQAPATSVSPESTSATTATEARQEQRVMVPATIPPLDTSLHSVPLDKVVFDTFQPVNRAVPLSQASPDLIERLRDAIPPIHDPKYQSVDEASWLSDQDLVIGYAARGRTWAYPIRILNFHEIVNDFLAAEPVLISYCPLCYSGIVFSRRLGDRVLTFGNTSALYESDMVMLDYETGSYWWQVPGAAIVGPLTGQKLPILPSITLTWGEWRKLHPQGQVLSRNTGYPRSRYDHDPFVGYTEMVNRGQFVFPVSQAGQDRRMQPGAKVLAVKIGDQARAYPLALLGRAATMDRLGGQEIVVFTDPSGPTGAAYDPVASGQRLTFETRSGEFADQQTGSAWDLSGRAVRGPLAGAQLPALPVRTTFWFAIVASEPEISVYELPAGGVLLSYEVRFPGHAYGFRLTRGSEARDAPEPPSEVLRQWGDVLRRYDIARIDGELTYVGTGDRGDGSTLWGFELTSHDRDTGQPLGDYELVFVTARDGSVIEIR